MIKRLGATGLIAAGMALLPAPAYADTNAGNSSSNRDSVQSGNNFGNVVNHNSSGRGATGLNNVNGNSVAATGGSGVRIDDVLD